MCLYYFIFSYLFVKFLNIIIFILKMEYCDFGIVWYFYCYVDSE